MSNILNITGRVEVGKIKGKEVIRTVIEPGEVIDLDKDDRLSEKDVKRIIKSGTGVMSDGKTQAVNKQSSELSAGRLVKYLQAIDSLDPDNKDDYTESGKPEVNALKQLVDGDVSASERDEAWEHYQALSTSE